MTTIVKSDRPIKRKDISCQKHSNECDCSKENKQTFEKSRPSSFKLNKIILFTCIFTLAAACLLSSLIFSRISLQNLIDSEIARTSNQKILEARETMKRMKESIVQGRKLTENNHGSMFVSAAQSKNGAVHVPGDQPLRHHGIVGIDKSGNSIYKIPTYTNDQLKDMDIDMTLYKYAGFNIPLSNTLPLDRVAQDNRDKKCKTKVYDIRGKTASVVIIFHNEFRSTLLRSIHSVLNGTPANLLDEIILVDDGSTSDWIKSDEIVNYVNKLPKTRLIRLPVRQGIVAARLAGIKAVKSPIFVILDSHIEVQPNWLEPLIHEIKKDPKSIPAPRIDSINPRTFKYNNSGIGCTLGLIWSGMEHGYDAEQFKHSTLPDRLTTDQSAVVTSPTMAGGLFAAEKNFFLNYLKGYDEGLKYWGVENLELSFRAWMCGGKLLCVPCSRVFHIFRQGGSPGLPGDKTLHNRLRVASGWMDEYGDIIYKFNGEIDVDFGDVSAIHKLRKDLNCKSFQWFLDNIWPESYIRSLDDFPYYGTIKNVGSGLYLDAGSRTPGSMSLQLSSSPQTKFSYFKKPGFITHGRNDEACLNSKDIKNGSWCTSVRETKFTIIPVKDDIIKIEDSYGKCLSQNQVTEELELADCSDSSLQVSLIVNYDFQHWSWERYKPTFVGSQRL